MAGIPVGKFTMGCMKDRDVEGNCAESETPAHEVSIARPFAMGKHEVTFL
jgi:formylglycine-generating enzyme required for sulfatase activity